MAKYFGTDGFRGEAGKTLTSAHAYKIGRFLGWYYSEAGTKKVTVAIGKDTRLSSYMLEYALVAGLTTSGADAYMLHVTTTPSVSYVVHQDSFSCGVMISASHNPFYDNGIKLVNAQGEKMDDRTLEKIELYLDSKLQELGVAGDDLPMAFGDRIGKVVDYSAGRNRYIGYLISLSAHSFKHLRVGLDCANGSSWMIAKSVFDALGATTSVIGAQPNGVNINEGVGSTHIEHLAKFVKENELDMGFAFDGDADRCIAVDEHGSVINGDHILYIFGKTMKDEGILTNNTVVTTIMSNMGLYKALSEAGIDYAQTTVGDRYVYENMVSFGNCVGGEQSGHIILSKYATTGDGILTAIKLAEACLSAKQTLSKLAEPVKMFPQVLKNIRVADKSAVREDAEVQKAVERISKELDGTGRILLRESGTEPLIRVMAEAESTDICEKYVDEVITLIKSRGLSL